MARTASVLVANGEIYNYRRAEAEFPNAKFTTNSDCEVPLADLSPRRRDFAKPLRGMYAIALARCARPHALSLARSVRHQAALLRRICRAALCLRPRSQALLKTDLVPRDIRREAATELMQLQFVTGRQTIFSHVNRVMPGETLTLTGGRIVGRQELAALPDGPPLELGEDEALKLLDAALMDSVAVHQRSDVPYGMFLSGGIDSSALLACMAKLNEKPVRAFTAAFPGTAARDEREHAETRRSMGAAPNMSRSKLREHDFWTQSAGHRRRRWTILRPITPCCRPICWPPKPPRS